MKSIVLALVLSMTALPVFAAELPFLRPSKAYSGVRVVDTPRGAIRQQINWAPQKIRTVTEIEGMQMTNIVRQDLGVMWIENPMMGGCLEQSIGDKESVTGLEQTEGYTEDQVTYRKVGTERIGEHDTTKYEVTSKDPEQPHTALFWVTEDNIMVRMEVAGGSPQERFTMRLEELKIGPQPDELFETSGECISMPNMPGMPGMPTTPPGQQ